MGVEDSDRGAHRPTKADIQPGQTRTSGALAGILTRQ